MLVTNDSIARNLVHVKRQQGPPPSDENATSSSLALDDHGVRMDPTQRTSPREHLKYSDGLWTEDLRGDIMIFNSPVPQHDFCTIGPHPQGNKAAQMHPGTGRDGLDLASLPLVTPEQRLAAVTDRLLGGGSRANDFR